MRQRCLEFALLVFASIGCVPSGGTLGTRGTEGDGSTGAGGTTGTGGVSATGGFGGLFVPQGGFGGFGGSSVGGSVTTGSGGNVGAAGSGDPSGTAGRGSRDIGPPVTCPAGTGTTPSSSLISDLSTASSDGLPVLAAPYRAYVTSNLTSEVSNGIWHLTGDKMDGAVSHPVKVGIDFGCVDASAYAGITFTIETTGSSCSGIGTNIFDASMASIYDDLSVTGQTRTTVRIPFAQMWFNGQQAVRAIEWSALSSVDSCRSEIRISDLGFFAAPGTGGNGGMAGATGAGGGTSGAGAMDGACPGGLETSLSSTLAADFSRGASGRYPVVEGGYSAFLLDYQEPLTSEISDGAWHVAGTALGPNGLANRAEKGVGIVFPCVDPSNYSGVSFTIDTSGANCPFVNTTITDVNGRSYSRGFGGAAKTTVQFPWPTGTSGWAGLKRVMWQPYSLDVTTACVFDWRIDDVRFY